MEIILKFRKNRCYKYSKTILKDNPKEVERLNGEEKLISYFIGKIMKASGGKINHKKIIEVLNKEIKEK